MADLSDENIDFLPLLKISNSQILPQFLHDCVDELIKRKLSNFDIDRYNSDIEWTLTDFSKARNLIQNFYRQLILKNEDITKLQNTNLGLNAQQAIGNCFEVRKHDIYQAIIKENILKRGHNLVENIDWKLKWIMGSSKFCSLKEPLLQVDLNCVKKCTNEFEMNVVNFEMNLKQLDNFINKMENIQNELEINK